MFRSPLSKGLAFACVASILGVTLMAAQPLPKGFRPSGTTYRNKIASIIEKNCVSCHRIGGVAPFRLDSYEAVASRAAMIKYVVANGVMPPWFAKDDGTRQWKNDRSLSESDRDDLLQWIENGAIDGTGSIQCKSVSYPEGWKMGKPDYIATVPNPVYVKSDGVMPYKNIIIPLNFADERWVDEIEVRPSAKQVVHHVLVYTISKGSNGHPRTKEQLDGINGFFGIYVPGNGHQKYAIGLGKRIPANSDLRIQIHYAPNGEAVRDQTQVGLKFLREAPDHEVLTFGIANLNLDIPPWASRHQDVAAVTLPADVKLISFLPHMHFRGASCRYEKVDAHGNREVLLDIPRYDADWQLMYEYRSPRRFKAGERIEFTSWFDNSDQNPSNPNPRQRVRWGEQSTDEMQLGYIEYYIPGLAED